LSLIVFCSICLVWYINKEEQVQQYEQILIKKLELLKNSKPQEVVEANTNIQIEMNKKFATPSNNKGVETSTLSAHFFSETKLDSNKTIAKINNSLARSAFSKFDKNEAFAMTSKVEGSDFIILFLPILQSTGEVDKYIVQYVKDDTVANLESTFSRKLFFLLLISSIIKAILMWLATLAKK
jgi:hypothetical protein